MSRIPLRHRRVPVAVFGWLLLFSLLMIGGAASSATNCFGKAPTVTGTAGDDPLSGTAGADVIVGLGGNDTIDGLGGADRICGGDGDDVINGGAGNDNLNGDSGSDRVLGGPGADKALGGEGNDTLQGQGGNDSLNGGPGTDNAAGGIGTDTCVAETSSGCEVVPPTGCSNPARLPATVTATNVAVVGSNAFTHHSSFGLCVSPGVCDYDYLDFRAEVRNNTGSYLDLGTAEIAIYNGSGTRIGTRFAYFEADVLAPGQRTVLTETVPSMIYTQGETPRFPYGWASWELIIDATAGSPGSYDDVIIGSGLVSITREASGGVEADGVAVNTLAGEITDINWWVVLYDSAGRLINAGTDFDFRYPDGLAPGERADMEATLYSWGPTCFATVGWGASGH